MTIGASKYANPAVSSAQSTATLSVTFSWDGSYTEMVGEAQRVSSGLVQSVSIGVSEWTDNGDGTYTVVVTNPWGSGVSAILVVSWKADATQDEDLVNANALDPTGMEAQLDLLAELIQQARGELNRRIRVVDPADVFTITTKAVRASKVLGFDASGDPLYSDPASPTFSAFTQDIVWNNATGPVFTDRTSGTKYRLYFDGGLMKFEVVT